MSVASVRGRRLFVCLSAASWLLGLLGVHSSLSLRENELCTRAIGELPLYSRTMKYSVYLTLVIFCLLGGCTGSPDDNTAPAASAIRHLLVIIQENHTFDNYFGRYCTAIPGSDPACDTGP